MPVTEYDLKVWEEFVSSVKPLKQKKGFHVLPDLPRRLKIKPRIEKQIYYTLDLHGYTLQEAYNIVFKFISIHFRLQSKHITIITGKGLNDSGKIKKEILLWFETPIFKEMISSFCWTNSGGTLKIELKKQRKNK